MNLLFLGGNRYFGKIVLKELLKKNYKIFLVNRNSKRKKIKHKNLVYISCDRKSLVDYKDLFRDIIFDKVFDNIAYRLEEVKDLHNILNNKIKHYVFTSSSITYLNQNDRYEAREKDWSKGKITNNMTKKYNGKDIKYAINKRKIENYLFKNKKINSTILRIPNVVGKDDFSLKTQKLIYYPYKKTEAYKIYNNNYIQFILKDDLVKIILKIIKKKVNKTEAYNIANNKIKIKNFYNELYKVKKLIRKRNYQTNRNFPLPINSLMNCEKIKKKMRIKFSSINKVINSIC